VRYRVENQAVVVHLVKGRHAVVLEADLLAEPPLQEALAGSVLARKVMARTMKGLV
jgi:hypothetical protein